MPIQQIYKRDGSLVLFDRSKILRAIHKAFLEVGEGSVELSEKLCSQVIDILENNFPSNIPAVEEIQDIIERTLINVGHNNIAQAFIGYRQKRREIREKQEKGLIENIPYKNIWNGLVWNLDHSCETIDKLNAHIKNDTYPQLVKDAEDVYEQELDKIVASILKKRDIIRMVIVSGPSSSGKTTTTERLAKKLKTHNIELVKLTVDNYFKGLNCYMKDGFGDYDFEGPEALDLPLINEHLTKLIKGEIIQIPRYSFKTGYREKETDSLQIKDNQFILIDSHFGLYDKLTEGVPANLKFGLYLETLCQLRMPNGRFVRWTDIRMLRRMIRDLQYRAYDPKKTVGHWHYVRRGELKNLIPYIAKADYVVNTSLSYELPILKHKLFKYFPDIIQAYKDDPERQDAYIRAQRVYDLLSTIETWSDESVVPQQSLLREFIGGGIYH
ncbi:MAG: ATP cone domain-containing protein [Patescibacteria group bacterium]